MEEITQIMILKEDDDDNNTSADRRGEGQSE